MRFPPLLPALLLAACEGQGDDAVPRANSVEELANRLDKLADRTSEDIEPPQRLAFLKRGDLAPEHLSRPGCRLHQDGRLLLAVNAAGAVGRIDGRRVKLAVSGPVGPTGGFFTAPGVTLSVGRKVANAGSAEEYSRGWPARLSIGGDSKRPVERHQATWICTR